ncbi:MAG: response regulator [Deltaproteobacteria bacterium]
MSRENHILLAEDEEAEIALVQLSLEENGIRGDEVTITRDGAEALDYLFRRGPYRDRPPGNPGLVILDLKLPKVTGLEILKEVRTDAGTKSVPVVIFSSSIHEKDRNEALRNGANAFIVKPMDLDAFSNCISSMLRLRAEGCHESSELIETGKGPA